MMGKKPNPETAVMPELKSAIDEAAAQVACRMSPLEMGLLIHPDARPVALEFRGQLEFRGRNSGDTEFQGRIPGTQYLIPSGIPGEFRGLGIPGTEFRGHNT